MRFFQDITLGQYVPGDSFIHRLDPRTKIISLMVMMIVVFSIGTMKGLILPTLFIFVVSLASRMPAGFILRGIRPFIWLFIFTMVIHILLTSGENYFSFGPVNISKEGIIQGFFVSIRLLYLILFSSILTLTTSPLELTKGIEKLSMPFKWFGVPVQDFSIMMMIAIRFIPILMLEAERIIMAQTSRGADFESGNILRRIRSLTPILIPLLMSAFRRADELALAMEARGYRGGKCRTSMKELHIKWADYVAFIITVIFGIMVFLL